MQHIFESNHRKLSIYFTAGYPNLEDTVPVLSALEKAGVDFVELGMPYSDPLADGPTIQESSMKAIENGMTLDVLFQQLEGFRQNIQLPVVLMGYYNQLLQYGMEKFIQKAAGLGVNGLIIPDLPLGEYELMYQKLFEQYNMGISFLITPQTSDARIRKIDELSRGFVYVVSSSSTTGKQAGFSQEQKKYFGKLAAMQLQNPMVIGFGIYDAKSFKEATDYAPAAIIGSAFIRSLKAKEPVEDFINGILEKSMTV